MADLFWLSDAQWARIEPQLPQGRCGARRVDDRRVLSGIVHMLRCGARWRDCPAPYGPPTTIYNRYHRWSGQGVWQAIFDALAAGPEPDTAAIDATHVRAHRCAAGGKGGPPNRPSADRAAGAPPSCTP